ncbi:MAG TPA: hypothetical protein DCR97_09500 [Deltaproteobacteria bacterium]|nr:hypothetical protein [Deltaproteobacteria bacterium]
MSRPDNATDSQARPGWTGQTVESIAQSPPPGAPQPDTPPNGIVSGEGSPPSTEPDRPGAPTAPPADQGTAPIGPAVAPSIAPQPVPARPFRPAPTPRGVQSAPTVRPTVPTPTVRRSPPAILPPAPAPGSLVQMQFDNIELRDLIRFVSNIMGRNFVFDESVVKGKATVLSPKSLTRDEVFRVFESVLNYQGFAVVPTPEALKIVRAADAKGLPIETLDRQYIGKTTPEEKIATMVCPLEYLDSNTMVGILRPLMARDAYLVSVPATNSLIMIDTEANLQRLNQVITSIDIPVSKQLSGIDVYNVQHTNAADLAKVLQSLLAEGKKAAAPKEKIFITAYAPTNSLLVSAPPEDMKEIRRIIDEVDTFRPQVLVEAAIIEVSATKGKSLGVEWLTGARSGDGGLAIGGSIAPSSPLLRLGTALTNTDSAAAIAAAAGAINPGLNLGVIGPTVTWRGKEYNSVAAFVQAVATEDDVNILSTPQILTMNNEEAEVVVGENRPYLTSTRVDSAGNPINTYDYRDVGVKLKVKPYINKDGLVYLNIYQEVTQVTTATIGAGTNVQPAPTTLKRSTKTTVGVKDAQTIVISGLIRDDSTGNRTGIPILSSIPLIGWLFGTRSVTTAKTNLLVFITPRIVYTAEALQKLSDAKKVEQEKMLGKGKP